MKKFRHIICLFIGIIIVSTFCSCTSPTSKPQQYTLVYMPSDGGRVSGEQIQIVDEGTDSETVFAIPNDGYEFVGWSDGVETAERTDINVKNDIDVKAYFKMKTE